MFAKAFFYNVFLDFIFVIFKDLVTSYSWKYYITLYYIWSCIMYAALKLCYTIEKSYWFFLVLRVLIYWTVSTETNYLLCFVFRIRSINVVIIICVSNNNLITFDRRLLRSGAFQFDGGNHRLMLTNIYIELDNFVAFIIWHVHRRNVAIPFWRSRPSNRPE